MTKPTDTLRELRKEFEANFLDGDDMDDCGRTLVRPDDVFYFFLEKIHSARKEAQMEVLEKIEGQIGRDIPDKVQNGLGNWSKIDLSNKDVYINKEHQRIRAIIQSERESINTTQV